MGSANLKKPLYLITMEEENMVITMVFKMIIKKGLNVFGTNCSKKLFKNANQKSFKSDYKTGTKNGFKNGSKKCSKNVT